MSSDSGTHFIDSLLSDSEILPAYAKPIIYHTFVCDQVYRAVTTTFSSPAFSSIQVNTHTVPARSSSAATPLNQIGLVEKQSSDDETSTKDRSRKRRAQKAGHRLRTHSDTLATFESVREFGKMLDLSDPSQAADYLTYLNDWFADLTYPTDFARFQDFASSWASSQDHRPIALRLLAPHNKVAWLFNRSWLGYLTEKEFNRRSVAKQGFDSYFNWYALGGALSASVAAIGVYSAFNSYNRTVEAVSPIARTFDMFNTVVTSVKDAATLILDWIKGFFSKIVEAVTVHSLLCKEFIKRLALVASLFLGVLYAKSHFPEWASDLKELIMGHHDFVTKQGHEDEFDSPSHETIDWFREHFFHAPRQAFWASVGTLPKLTNYARSLEYVFANMRKLYACAKEAITGVPSPRTQFEESVVEHDTIVRKLKLIIAADSTEAIMDMEIDLIDAEAVRDNLHLQMTRSSDLRPFITNILASAKHELTTIRHRFETVRTSAKPRPTTVWLYIWGGPASRKTTLVRQICVDTHHHLLTLGCKFVKRELQDQDIFVWSPAEPYFDMYGNSFYTVHDDLFQSTSTESRNPDARAIISMIAPFPMSLPVADLNQKGKKFFTSRALITTSNIDNFYTANLGLDKPDALDSRRTITVEAVDSTPGAEKFRLDYTQATYSGTSTNKSSIITYDDLVGIFARCIIQRDEEFQVPYKPRSIPPYLDGFFGGRLFMPSLGSKDTRADIVNHPPDRIKPDPEPRDRRPRQRRRNVGASSSKQAGGDDKGKEKVTDPELTDIEKLEQAEASYHQAKVAYVPPPSAEVPCLPIIGETTLVHQFDAAFPPPFTLSLTSADEFVISRVFTPRMYHAVLAHSPSRFAPDFTRKQYNAAVVKVLADCHEEGFDFETFVARFFNEYQRYCYADSPYAAFLHHFECPAWLPTTHQGRLDFWKDKLSTTSLTALLTVSIASFSIAMAACKIALNVLMPPICHKDVEVQTYDSDPKVRRKPEITYQRARVIPNPRAKLILGPRYAPPSEPAKQGHESNYARIAENYDRVTLHLSPTPVSKTEALELPSVTSSWCICIGGTRYLIPMHTLLEKGDVRDVRYVGLSRHCRARFALEDVKFIADIGGDVGIFEFPSSLSARPDLISRHHFEDGSLSHAKLLHIRPYEHLASSQLVAASSWNLSNYCINPTDTYPAIVTNFEVHGIPNESGLCGSIYVNSVTGKIVAMHMGGDPRAHVAYATGIMLSDVSRYAVQGSYDFTPALSVPLASAQCAPGFQVLGTVPDRKYAVWLNVDSRLTRSTLDYKSFPVPETTDAPAMLAKTGDVSPLKNALIKISNQSVSGPTPPPLEDYTPFFPDGFNRQAAGRTISLMDAVYGIPGYVSPLDFTKSLGFYYKRMGFRSRKAIFPGRDTPVPIHPLVEFDILNYVHDIEAGKPVSAGIVEENLKDEIRDAERVRAGKTRLFSVFDLRTFIATKMKFACFFAELEKDPAGTPCTIGLNVHSSQWGRMYSRLKGNGEKRLPRDGDFGSWDISLKPDAEHEFVLMVQSFHSEPHVVKIIVALNLRGCWHIVGQLVFVRPFGMSSGSFLTSVFNTFTNWLYHAKAWRALFPEVPFTVVVSYFHGDDSLCSVPEKYAAYDCEYLSKFFRENYQMEYTASDKSIAREKTWEEITFLKRRFALGPLGVMAPLALGSISNMVKWTEDPGDPIVMASVVRSALDEAFHHGKSLYGEVEQWARKESIRCNLALTVPDFATACQLHGPAYSR